MPEQQDDWKIIKDAGPDRRLTAAALNAQIDSALAGIGPGHGAVVAVADTKGVKLVGISRIDEHWSVTGVVEHDWKGDYRASAAVRYAW